VTQWSRQYIHLQWTQFNQLSEVPLFLVFLVDEHISPSKL